MDKKLYVLFLIVAALLLAAACGNAASPPSPTPTGSGTTSTAPAKAEWERKWESALAGARKEGELSILTPGGDTLRSSLTPVLKEKFGINLQLTYGNQSELLTKMDMERRSGIYTNDMTLFSPVAYLDFLKPNGMVTPLSPYLLLPDVKDNKNWVNSQFPMFDKDGTAVALTSAYFSYVFINTDMVKESEMRSYRDLLNPKWTGKMVMLDPTAGPSPTETFVNYVVPRFMGVAEGEKYLRDLVKQDLVYTRDRRLHVEWVARGKYPIGIGTSSPLLADFVNAGAPLTFIRPEEGGLLAVAATGLAIVDKAPHPNAATVFLNWVLGEEGQRIFAAGYNAPPRRLGVPFTGSDQFAVVRPGDKTIESDEAFYVEGKKTANWAKDIFGPVVNK